MIWCFAEKSCRSVQENEASDRFGICPAAEWVPGRAPKIGKILLF